MVNYKIFNAKEFTTGQSGSLDRAWGVMVSKNGVTSGSLVLEGVADGNYSGTVSQTTNYSTIKLEHLAVGEPLPCYVKRITVTTGSAYLLA
jgi:hypothetical protein